MFDIECQGDGRDQLAFKPADSLKTKDLIGIVTEGLVLEHTFSNESEPKYIMVSRAAWRTRPHHNVSAREIERRDFRRCSHV